MKREIEGEDGGEGGTAEGRGGGVGGRGSTTDRTSGAGRLALNGGLKPVCLTGGVAQRRGGAPVVTRG